MMKFSKKLFLLTSVFAVSVVMAKNTKKLQLLVFPADSSYIFALNTGTGISNNPGAVRPQGSYYITNALIFPGGTIDKNSPDYSIDKDGNPINLNDNIGMAYFYESLLQTVDFNTPPALGTRIELSRLDLVFKNYCGGLNSLYCLGEASVGTLPIQPAIAIINFEGGVAAGTGCNAKHAEKNSYQAKVYVAQTGPVESLIEIEFADDINYKKNN